MEIDKMIKATQQDDQFKNIFLTAMNACINENLLDLCAFMYAMGMYRAHGGEVTEE